MSISINTQGFKETFEATLSFGYGFELHQVRIPAQA